MDDRSICEVSSGRVGRLDPHAVIQRRASAQDLRRFAATAMACDGNAMHPGQHPAGESSCPFGGRRSRIHHPGPGGRSVGITDLDHSMVKLAHAAAVHGLT